MKTLPELAKEISKNPDQIVELLTTFRTTSREVREFLFSLQSVPVYIVPALIETFSAKHCENEPTKIRDLMDGNKFLGSFFVLVEDGSDWVYAGMSTSGKPLARPINSALIMEQDPDKDIRFVF